MTETMNEEMRFTFLAKPDPRGHKFFSATKHWDERGTYAGDTEVVPCSMRVTGLWLCDDSGRTPASADEGPIRVIETEPLRVSDFDERVADGRVVVVCRVWVEREQREGSVLLSPIEAEWVKAQTGMTVKVAGSRRLAALARLIQSS